MIKRNLSFKIGVIILCMFFNISNSHATDKNTPKHPPYLRIPIEGEISVIDPGLTVDTASIEIVEQLFLGLTDFDPNTYEPVPELATDWSVSPDGTVYRFNLRKGVTWTNGEPVTANDIVWAIQRNIDPTTKCPYAYMLFILKNAEDINTGKITDISQIGVKAIDDMTVEFYLKNPAAYFPSMAGLWVYRPVHAKTLQTYGEHWTDPANIQTNGSYMLDAWFEGSMMILKKNPKYYEAHKVKIDEVRYYIVPESFAGLIMYNNSDLDITGGLYLRLPMTEIPKIIADPVIGKEYSNQPLFCTSCYAFNTKRTPVDNPLVRRALSAVIDKALLIEVITRGNEQPAQTFTRPPIFGSVDPSDKEIGIGFDPIQAKKWLAEAGYPDGKGFPTINLVYNLSETHDRITKSFQTFFRYYLNIKLEITPLQWSEYLEQIEGKNPPHMFRYGWCADYPDANNWLNELFHPTKSSNYIRWDNQEFAQLVEKAQQDTNPVERKKLYRRAEQILCGEEAGIIPIYYETAQYLVKPWIQGWYHVAMGGQHIRNWSFKE